MSKFTTEVRYICEVEAGLSESKGFNDVDDIVEEARGNIFKEFPIFDEEYRPTLECNILRHYYTREIGFETVGLWKLHLNNRMNEIMPKYNKLYESARLNFDPLSDTDLRTEKQGSNDKSGVNVSQGENSRSDTRQYSNESSSTDTRNRVSSNTTENENIANSDISNTGSSQETKSQMDKYSETPQGGITGLQDGTYLTNARIIDGTDESVQQNAQSSVSKGKGSVTEDGSENVNEAGSRNSNGNENGEVSGSDRRTDSNVVNTVEQYLEHVSGKRGSQSYAKMILEYRETFLNIDRMIIDELSDLFFGLWE